MAFLQSAEHLCGDPKRAMTQKQCMFISDWRSPQLWSRSEWISSRSRLFQGSGFFCPQLLHLPREGNGNPFQYSCLENPMMEEPGGLQSRGSRRVGHDWVTSLSLFTFMHWRRKWQPTPVFLPGESQGQRRLVGCRLWGRTESDTTDATQQQKQPPSSTWGFSAPLGQLADTVKTC